VKFVVVSHLPLITYKVPLDTYGACSLLTHGKSATEFSEFVTHVCCHPPHIHGHGERDFPGQRGGEDRTASWSSPWCTTWKAEAR
jgi:hypothetical protein